MQVGVVLNATCEPERDSEFFPLLPLALAAEKSYQKIRINFFSPEKKTKVLTKANVFNPLVL